MSPTQSELAAMMHNAASLRMIACELPKLTEAVYTLCALVEHSRDLGASLDTACEGVAIVRDEVRHALAAYAPPSDSYRAQDARPFAQKES